MAATQGLDHHRLAVGEGPRHHMMFAEPGSIRVELIWTGT